MKYADSPLRTTELARCLAHYSLKKYGEVVGVFELQCIGDLGHRHVTLSQQRFGVMYAHAMNDLQGTLSADLFHGFRKMFGANAQGSGIVFYVVPLYKLMLYLDHELIV